jgi:transcriptional regulator with XRE-family HTH domain
MTNRDDSLTHFGREFRRLVLARYRTLEEFLRAANLRKNTVFRWETAADPNPDRALFKRAADALEVDERVLWDLLDASRREHGAAESTERNPLAALTLEQIRHILHDREATRAQIADWAAFAAGGEAQWHIVSEPFLHAFLDELDQAAEAGEASQDKRLARAATKGREANLALKARAAGARPPNTRTKPRPS